jgi:hypothetical protein
MIHPPFPPSAVTGQAGREPLVPLHEPHARELRFQGVQSSQYFAGLETDLPTERSRHPDDDLVDTLLVHEPAQVDGEIATWYHVERAGQNAASIRDGDAGAYLSEVEGGDSPAVGWRQDLLRVR